MNELAIFSAVDWGEIIKIVVILLVIFGSAIGKIIASIRGAKPPGVPQRPRPMPPQQPQQPQVQVQGPKPKSVKDEIDDFLRRAAQKRQPQSAIPSTSSYKQQQESNVPSRRISRPSAPISQHPEPIQAEVVRERSVGGGVSEHVNKYLDEKEFSQRASKMGGDVAAADTKIEKHLKEAFGHGISQLASKTGETAAAPMPKSTGFFEDDVPILAAAGTGLASLLNNIDNLRQAIVVNEILQRPIDRWK
jgi:hypothetical protein